MTNNAPARRAGFALHRPATIGAFLAFDSAFLAMIVFEICAAYGALVADRRAQFAKFHDMLGIGRHQAGGFLADTRAFHHLRNMVLARRHVGLVKTQLDAFMTRLRASVACVDAGLILISAVANYSHLKLLLCFFYCFIPCPKYANKAAFSCNYFRRFSYHRTSSANLYTALMFCTKKPAHIGRVVNCHIMLLMRPGFSLRYRRQLR
jgi:hypothetical protein